METGGEGGRMMGRRGDGVKGSGKLVKWSWQLWVIAVVGVVNHLY
jgi:hypothetical protein